MKKEIQELTPEERRAILHEAFKRKQREIEDAIIARELDRRTNETKKNG
jgi:hypothetical protein